MRIRHTFKPGTYDKTPFRHKKRESPEMKETTSMFQSQGVLVETRKRLCCLKITDPKIIKRFFSNENNVKKYYKL